MPTNETDFSFEQPAEYDFQPAFEAAPQPEQNEQEIVDFINRQSTAIRKCKRDTIDIIRASKLNNLTVAGAVTTELLNAFYLHYPFVGHTAMMVTFINAVPVYRFIRQQKKYPKDIPLHHLYNVQLLRASKKHTNGKKGDVIAMIHPPKTEDDNPPVVQADAIANIAFLLSQTDIDGAILPKPLDQTSGNAMPLGELVQDVKGILYKLPYPTDTPAEYLTKTQLEELAMGNIAQKIKFIIMLYV